MPTSGTGRHTAAGRPAAGTAAGGRERATALPPEERRARLVAATLPLVLEHGRDVTTRQVAEAAGVAEGTIFRVFPDKDALIEAVVAAALDPGPTERELREIDPDRPLDERLRDAVEIMRRRVANVFQLMSAAGMLSPSGTPPPAPDRKLSDLDALASVFEPDRDQLRRTPEEAAHLLRGLTLVGTHPALRPEPPLQAAEIVSLLLDGVRARPGSAQP
jgi:AcrR family transcriptional regulator